MIDRVFEKNTVVVGFRLVQSTSAVLFESIQSTVDVVRLVYHGTHADQVTRHRDFETRRALVELNLAVGTLNANLAGVERVGAAFAFEVRKNSVVAAVKRLVSAKALLSFLIGQLIISADG